MFQSDSKDAVAGFAKDARHIVFLWHPRALLNE